MRDTSVREHNDDNPATPTTDPDDFAARPARLADGRIRQPDGTILPNPRRVTPVTYSISTM